MSKPSSPQNKISWMMHLVCSGCNRVYSADQVQTYCQACNSPLLVNYDLDEVRKNHSRAVFTNRPSGMWRWREFLPVQTEANQISLGEGETPLVSLKNLGGQLGFTNLFLKDEGQNPTASFKARGMATAISRARELGIKQVALSGRENAARALAAYASRAGLQAHVFMSDETSPAVLEEVRLPGVEVELVQGLESSSDGILDQTRLDGWFDLTAFHEPYRVEGQKTIGFEIAEALDWVAPDVIICPTGFGSNLVSVWKAFAELEALGWLEGGKRPRFVAVQARGCAPLIKAFEAGASFCDYWTNARATASNLIVPKSFADQLILKIIAESQGAAVSVSDEAIQAAQRQMESDEGLCISPEGAAAFAALFKLVQKKWARPGERIVLLNTGQKPKH